MSVRVKLPPGCSGVDSRDGTKYTSNRPGGTVTINDQHAAEMSRSKRTGSDNGMLSLKESWSFGTRTGRWCGTCRRLWNSWSIVCPKCGRDTVVV